LAELDSDVEKRRDSLPVLKNVMMINGSLEINCEQTIPYYVNRMAYLAMNDF
jgi:hypothetical protein